MIYNRTSGIDHRSSEYGSTRSGDSATPPDRLALEGNGGAWRLGRALPGQSGVVFSFVSLGVCVFRRGGETPIELREGDFLVMRSPPHWTLGLNENSAPVDYVTGRKSSDARLVRLGDGTQPKTCVLGGRFVFEPTNAMLVEHLIPPLLIVRDLDAGAGRLRKVLDLLRDEALDALPGREFAIARLLELLLVETIRSSGRGAAAGMERGFLCGLADEYVARVLVAMHADIAHRWTVVELARSPACHARCSPSVSAESSACRRWAISFDGG